MAGRVIDEAFVTTSVARQLKSTGWDLHSVARPQMGSGVLLRPDGEGGRREKLKGGVVIDVIASRGSAWLFLECKDRFSLDDLDKLRRLRDTPAFEGDLVRLTGGVDRTERLFGLAMPDTAATRARVDERTGELDVFIGVAEDGRCRQLGGSRPVPGM